MWQADHALIAVLCVVGFFAIVFAYYVIAKENQAHRKDSMALITIMGNHMVTTLQIRYVFSLLLISCPEAFVTLLAIRRLINLDLHSLNFECVVGVGRDPVLAYCGNLFGLTAGYHADGTLLPRAGLSCRDDSGEHILALIGAIGTIFMAVFVTISHCRFRSSKS